MLFTAIPTAFLEKLHLAHCREHIETMFLCSSAPVLRKVRPAVLITLRPHCLSAWHARQNALRKATGLRTLEIMDSRGLTMLLIYDEHALGNSLMESETLDFLASHGYPASFGLDEALDVLKKRFFEEGFPHEIGVFLGYPLKDVQAFIENKGKNYVYCRYWKVYHDIDQAKEIFRRIDDAQRHALEVLRKPVPVHVAADLLKSAGYPA